MNYPVSPVFSYENTITANQVILQFPLMSYFSHILSLDAKLTPLVVRWWFIQLSKIIG